jgi:hypothetical protein
VGRHAAIHSAADFTSKSNQVNPIF